MAANDNKVACGIDFTAEELLASCVGVDAGGKNYIRFFEATEVGGSTPFSCGNPVTPDDLVAVLKSCICLNTAGDACIRYAPTA